MKTIKNLILILFIISLFLISGCTNINLSDKKNYYQSSGSPLPDGYMYKLCNEYNSNWICDNNDVNDINCCKCDKLNETFYFEIGCSNSSTEDICTNTGGNLTVDINSRPNIKKCLCPSEYSFNSKKGCFK